MIFGLPAILGFLPLLLYIILSFRGKDILMVVLYCVVLGAILTKQTPVTLGVAISSALGSFLGLIGFIILMGAGVGEVLSQTGVAQNIVRLVITKMGVKNKEQAMIATMVSSVILVSLLGSMAGSNAILAPIIIPIVASFNITPNTLGVLLHGAGATGLYLGPFVPPVVTTLGLTGITYGQYLLHVGIPISIIVWIITFLVAKQTQKATEGKFSYSEEDKVNIINFEPNEKVVKATNVFLVSMLALIIYGIIAKAGAAYVIVVMGIVGFLTGIVAGLKAEDVLKALIKGSSRMYWLFFLFVLYDPFLNFITKSGAFDALAGYLKPLIDVGGPKLFMIISTLVGVFGVTGAAVAQEKVIHELFLPIVNQLNFPMHLWALVLLVGSQITFFAYPTGDMVGQMGLARSKDLKSMIKNGILITIFTVLYVVVRAFLYKF
ncbi:Na+/H+ antiporter NhaC family protein [Thermovenabulum sp.]|uniref:GntT/GntP/DsdX family permease n=1 Tax=Thermovenabulum sp. TaxID=3100335 RepID=UPI003C7ADF7C